MTTLSAMQTIILDRMRAGELLELTQTGFRIVMQGRERHAYAQFKPATLPEATA